MMSSRMAAAIVAVSIGFAATGAESPAIDVRTPEEGRLWQTVFDPTEPIGWRWEARAVSARIAFSNCLTRTVSATDVNRNGLEITGSAALPAVEVGETLFDVTIEQSDANGVVSTDSARVAVLPGTNGGGIEVRSTAKMTRGPRDFVFAYDPMWSPEAREEGYAKLCYQADRDGEMPLDARGGYDVFSYATGDSAELTLMLGQAQWRAGLYPYLGGFMFFVR